jgi:hypothetical protein
VAVLTPQTEPSPFRFAEIARAAGIDFVHFSGMTRQKYFPTANSSGVALFDYDNDGWLDLYFATCTELPLGTAFHGPNRLYKNRGGGAFQDVTESSGLGFRGFCNGIVAGDIDNDGDADVFLANFGPNALFLNNGDGTFRDITAAAGVAGRPQNWSYGGAFLDYDHDGDLDLFVANYGEWVYPRDDLFCGDRQRGVRHAEDVNGDGRPELFVTNFAHESAAFYLNLGKGLFLDSTPRFGLAADTMPFVGWGCALADLDNDGWPDCFVSNGHVDDNRRELGQAVDYAEPALLFHNLGGKRFRLATRDGGPYFDTPHVGRGVAFGDFDNDGDIDIIVNHKDQSPAILRNDTGSANHWVRLDLRGTRSNRDAVGARVEVVAGGRTIHRQRKGGYSMESSHDPRLLIGLGTAGTVTRLTVRWPSGAVSTREQLAVDRAHTIVEPAGASAAGPGSRSRSAGGEG